MLNELYNDGVYHLYTYPLINGLVLSAFLGFSVLMGKARLQKAYKQGAILASEQLSARAILDLTAILLFLLVLASKLGGVFYSRAVDPLTELVDLKSHEFSSDWGVFAFALLAMLTPKRMRATVELFQTWAALLLLLSSIGTLGCFCYGCCFGRPTQSDTWYSVRFPTRRNAEGAITGAPAVKEQMQLRILSYSAKKSLPVHPVQLYHFGLLLIGGTVVTLASIRGSWDGWPVFSSIYYMIVRVGLDPLRGDYEHGLIGDKLAPRTRLLLLTTLLFIAAFCFIRTAYRSKRRIGWR